MADKTVKIKLRCDEVRNYANGQMAAFKHVNAPAAEPPKKGQKTPKPHENEKYYMEIPQATMEISILPGSPQIDFFEPGQEYFFEVTKAKLNALPKE